jgi:hypothetical protein
VPSGRSSEIERRAHIIQTQPNLQLKIVLISTATRALGSSSIHSARHNSAGYTQELMALTSLMSA